MDIINFGRPENNTPPAKGKLLIAEPFLNDPNFMRSVVVLCEYGDDGTVGFVLNNATEYTLDELVTEIPGGDFKIYQGGPVQVDTLHMLHRIPDILGGKEIALGIYWGGDYEALQEAILNGSLHTNDIRLFIGYSGWAAGQLERELKEGSWMVIEMAEGLIFDAEPDAAWKQAVRLLGKEFAYLENLPINPSLN
jgi:putative transcriptional regulator